MKPLFKPIPFPVEAAPWGEELFQPLVLSEYGVVVAGGSSALFLTRVFERQELSWTIKATDRITGFAAQGGDLYVQDGPVLSRWSLKTGLCSGAINLVVPSQRWTPKPEKPDWAKLHALPEPLREKQQTLKRLRRRYEFHRLRQAIGSAIVDRGGGDRDPDLYAVWNQLLKFLSGDEPFVWPVLGEDLARAEADAAALAFSAPVVREHQIWGKAAGMVFVISADGTLHPLDDTLEHLGTVRLDNAVIPALALAEYPTDADTDQFDCRLYYVTTDGTVRVLDGGSLPPVALTSWNARGQAAPDARVRMRILNGMLWGAGAQGTGVFALPIDEPGAQSRVRQPSDRSWRWLELRPDFELGLCSELSGSSLFCFSRAANVIDRWGARPAQRPCFTTFLPQSTAPKPRGRPLCVLEFEQEPIDGTTGPELRWLVANTVDAAEKTAPDWRAPVPETLARDTLDGWSGSDGNAPKHLQTQPSISRQHAYVVARNLTTAAELRALCAPGSSWDKYVQELMATHHDMPGITAALGDIKLPPMPGHDSLYAYSPGSAITTEQADRARITLDGLRALVTPPWLQIDYSFLKIHMRDFILRFGRGAEVKVKSDKEGWVQLPLESVGDTVTVLAMGFGSGDVLGVCTIALGRGNRVIEGKKV